MKKKKSDFLVGFVIFTAIIILFAGVVWLKNIDLTSTKVDYTILVPKVGGLQAGDPVSINGVKSGTVTNVSLYGHEVAVRIRIDSEIVITESSSVKVVNVGLLGERMIEITLSPKGTPYKPNSGNNITYIPGGFDSGIAEAIGMVGDIMHEASGLLDTVETILLSTIGSEEFIDFFNRTTERLDSIVVVTERLLTTNDTTLTALINDLRESSAHIRSIASTNEPHINEIVLNAEQLSKNALDLTTSLDSLLLSVDGVIAKVDSGDGAISHLLNSRSLTDQIEETLASLDTLIAIADERGLRLRVRLGFGRESKRLERD